jgi:hypothetical protein
MKTAELETRQTTVSAKAFLSKKVFEKSSKRENRAFHLPLFFIRDQARESDSFFPPRVSRLSWSAQ